MYFLSIWRLRTRFWGSCRRQRRLLPDFTTKIEHQQTCHSIKRFHRLTSFFPLRFFRLSAMSVLAVFECPLNRHRLWNATTTTTTVHVNTCAGGATARPSHRLATHDVCMSGSSGHPLSREAIVSLCLRPLDRLSVILVRSFDGKHKSVSLAELDAPCNIRRRVA